MDDERWDESLEDVSRGLWWVLLIAAVMLLSLFGGLCSLIGACCW